MSELRLVTPPPRAELLSLLRARLGHAVPGARVVAEDVLGEESRIDLVAVDPTGAAVVVLVGDAGDDLELVGRGIAQRAWVEARLRDWRQLAPGLGLRPEAGVRICLLCRDFRAETRAAARALGAERLTLIRYRCVAGVGGDLAVLLEHAVFEAAGDASPPGTEPPAATFRTGLTDADLGLTDAERSAFESLTPTGPHGDVLRRQ